MRLLYIDKGAPSEAETQRASVRINMIRRASVFEYQEGLDGTKKGGYICEAQTEDISKDGIRLISGHNLNAEKGDMFIVEFSLLSNTSMSLPIRLMRVTKELGVRSVYDYGFMFDFTDNPMAQKRLVFSIFEAKVLQ